MIVLDTNVLSELMRPAPSPAVVAWANRQAEQTLFTTAITLGEIRFGIAALPEGRRRSQLEDTFENGIRPLLGNRVLDYDEPASVEYAALRARARSRGRAIADVDAMIAAIARVRRFAVATRDVAAFEVAGVKVVDPFA